MDKQIIIDDVDISGCEYCLKMTKYRCTIQRDVYKCLCEENPNCHFKQSKRKEKECEKYKQTLTEIKDYCNKYPQNSIGFKKYILQKISECEANQRKRGA